ncbi:Amino acid adenylation domain-containing protein OS=Streptomyces alboniger OX=132473 GN=CP975_32025 PE=4 SV=1 [Streptomyces alboniger]
MPGIERMVGNFINTLPVRVRMVEDESLPALLARVQEEQAALLPDHHLALSDIQRLVGTGAALRHHHRGKEHATRRGNPARGYGRSLLVGGDSEDATHCPLRMQAVPGLDTSTLGLHLGYLPDNYELSEVQELLAQMVRLLGAVAEGLDIPVEQLERIPADTEQDRLAQWGGY